MNDAAGTPDHPRSSSISARTILILAVVAAAVIAFLVFQPGGIAPLPQLNVRGVQLSKFEFLAVPSPELLAGGEAFIPVLGEFAMSFADLGVEEHGAGSDRFFAIAPQLAPLGAYTPKTRSSGSGNELHQSLSLSRVSSRAVPLGRLGVLNLEFGGKKSLDLSNLREITVDLGDFDLVTALATAYHGKANRVYFFDRIAVSDIASAQTAGVEFGLEPPTAAGTASSGGLGVSGKFNSEFKGLSVILGGEIQVLKSSTLTSSAHAARTPQERLAFDLQYVLGIQPLVAQAIAAEPARAQPMAGGARVLFESPTLGTRKSIVTGPRQVEADEIQLPPGPHVVRYTQVGSTTAYAIQLSLEVADDLEVAIDPAKTVWAAVSWERLHVAREYERRKDISLEASLGRIDDLSRELFEDAVRATFGVNATLDSARDELRALLETAPAKELRQELAELERQIESDAIGTPDTWSADRRTRYSSALLLLEHLEKGTPPPEDLLVELEDLGETIQNLRAHALWMKARYIQDNFDREDASRLGEMLEIGDLYDQAANLYADPSTKTSLRENALAAYVTAGTRVAEASQDLLRRKEEGTLTIQETLVALQRVNWLQTASRNALNLLRSHNIAPRTRVGWKAQTYASGVPYPWQKTVYRYGQGSEFDVTSDGTARIGTQEGSIQVSALVNVPLATYPYATWRWRVHEFPPQGNLTRDETDDQAIQVAVTYEEEGITPDIHAVDLVWDSNAPKGTTHTRKVGFPPFGDELHYLVIESGKNRPGVWQTECVDLAEAYESAVNMDVPPPARVLAVTVQSNSWHTGAKVSAEIGEIRFTSDPSCGL